MWDRRYRPDVRYSSVAQHLRYASRKYWDQIAKEIRPVYTAPTEAAAKERFVEFTEKWGSQYPAIIRLWENAWSEFVPFLDYDVESRRVIGSTNAIVIWGLFGGVVDVRHAGSGSVILRAGRGYLQSSRRQSLRRDDASCPGGFTDLVA